MNKNIIPGRICFELNNNPDSQEPLNEFFMGLGFDVAGRKGDQYFKRITTFKDKHGLQFDIIWFKNISTIRFGEWGKSFVDIVFEKIVDANVPNVNHLTLDFMVGGKRTASMSIYNGGEGKE